MTEWVDWATKQSWGTDGGSTLGGPPKCVLHTTETRHWPGYADGKTVPHFTVMPLPLKKNLVVRQHVPLSRAARALQNKDGGVQTNRDGAIQIELIGTCDPSYRRKYPDAFPWFNPPVWALEELAVIVKRLSALTGFKLHGPPLWPSYPSSYANGAGQRLSQKEWDNFSGICGHMHVPENSHGDPGSFPFSQFVKIMTTSPTVKDDDVVTQAEITAIAKETVAQLLSSEVGPNPVNSNPVKVREALIGGYRYSVFNFLRLVNEDKEGPAELAKLIAPALAAELKGVVATQDIEAATERAVRAVFADAGTD